MNKHLPERPDLTHLKDQAKSLLTRLRSSDTVALAQVSTLNLTTPFKLADAQLAVARSYGFDSWAKLKKHVESTVDHRAAFFKAIKSRDQKSVRTLFKQDPSLIRANDPTEFGAVPISIAAQTEDRSMIDLVLELGADINGRSDWWAGGFGALDLASEPISKYLLLKGATLTLHAAARLGFTDEVRQFVEADPNSVNVRGGDGQFPLHFAKSPDIVDILVNAGASLDARDIDHESTAAQWQIRNEPVLRRLVECGATPDIFIATMLDDPAMISAILNATPTAIEKRTAEPGDPFMPQAPGGHIYVYTLGARQFPHMVAHHFGKANAYRYLITKLTLTLKLLNACWLADRGQIDSIVAEYPNIVKELSMGNAATLADAAWHRCTNSVKLMLELGFNPNARASEDSTAIDRAAFHGFDDVIEAILPYGPDLTVKNAYGGTPLRACIYGSMHSWRKDGNFPRSVELLIEAGSELPDELNGSPQVKSVLKRYGVPR